MTSTQLAARIRFKTKTDSNTFTDADMLPIVNEVKDDFASKITEKNENYFVIPEEQDIVASSVTAREYPLPDNLLNGIITVEAALDSNNPTQYVAVLPYTGGMTKLVRDLNGITEANIVNAFDNYFPRYVLTRRGIYLLSGTITGTITNGLMIRCREFPADLTVLNGSTDLSIDPSNTTFGVPKQLHELWATAASIAYKSDRPKPIPLSSKEQTFAQDLQRALDSLSRDDDQAIIIGSLPDSDSAANLGANV